MKNFAFLVCLLLALGACQRYNGPSARSNPATMSSDTLCYRYATAKHDKALVDEVARRNLNCAVILENDPLYQRR